MPARTKQTTRKTIAASMSATAAEYRQSAVNLSKTDWRLLRRMAEVRTDDLGSGRPSVSAVIQGLIDNNRKALEAEARKAVSW